MGRFLNIYFRSGTRVPTPRSSINCRPSLLSQSRRERNNEERRINMSSLVNGIIICTENSRLHQKTLIQLQSNAIKLQDTKPANENKYHFYSEHL
jgi:hypothetical protein